MNGTHGGLISYWDRKAKTYDAPRGWTLRYLYDSSRPWVCSRARGTTLEVAIGTGANLPHYPDDVDLTGVDWSARMLDSARWRAQRMGRAVTLQQADAAALPFPTGAFDAVVITFSLCCIPDERAALLEALRILRPGGSLLLADHVVATHWPLRLLQHSLEAVSRQRTGEHYTRRPLVTLQSLDATMVETERSPTGLFERVHARKSSRPS